jgi:hypothetical protein
MSYSLPFTSSSPHLLSRSSLSTARYRYEAARSFDLDDDLEFCPGLLTEEEMQCVHSSSSDRSSNSSGSPSSSPLQHQIQPTPSPLYSSYQSGYPTKAYPSPTGNVKLPQQTSRVRNAIPIVNPNTGMRVSSPPLLGSNTRTGQHTTGLSRRLW